MKAVKRLGLDRIDDEERHQGRAIFMIEPTELERRTQWNGLMSECLAEMVDLLTQVKQACWNVKRTQSTSLHELFEEIAREVECYSDMVAERIVQLGGIARGTVRAAAVYSRLEEYPLVVGGGNHVEAVGKALAAFRHDAYDAMGEISALGDGDTVNLFADICCGIDKWLKIIQARSKSAELPLRNQELRQGKDSRNHLISHKLVKPMKRSSAPGFRFLTKFQQTNQNFRKEIACLSSINFMPHTIHA